MGRSSMSHSSIQKAFVTSRDCKTQDSALQNAKEVVEPTLHDEEITLDSYILSNTAYQEVGFWGTHAEFAENHVLFDEDDNYIEILFKRILNA
jgi:hypothetical protein